MDTTLILSIIICVLTAMLVRYLTGVKMSVTNHQPLPSPSATETLQSKIQFKSSNSNVAQNIFKNNKKFDEYGLYHLIVQSYLNTYCDRYIPNDIYNIVYKYYFHGELAFRNSCSMTSNGEDKVYIFGGKYRSWPDDSYTNSRIDWGLDVETYETYLKSIWEITIINDENRLSVNWKPIITAAMQPASLTHASLLHHNDKLYLIGGDFSAKLFHEILLSQLNGCYDQSDPKVNELFCLDLNNKVNGEYRWNNIVIEQLSILKGINCAHVYKDHILVLGWSNESKSEYVLFQISLYTYETDTININYEINSKFQDVGFDTTLMNETLIIFASNNLYGIDLNTYTCRKISEKLLYQIECPLLLSFGESIIIAGGGQREKILVLPGDPPRPVSKEIILFDIINECRVDCNIELVKHDLFYRMEGCVVNNLIVLFGGCGPVADDNVSVYSGYRFNNIYVTEFN